MSRRCSRRHPGCTPAHAELVENYRAARQAYLEALEAETALYRAELDAFRAAHPPLTFKAWLTGGRLS
ncbi:MAG: hypothetical protein ACRDQA_23760 [Nocardioidaceae bacterium]